MHPVDISSVERTRFPLPVSRSHPAEWYVRRRLSLQYFLLGLGFGMCATWAVILAGLA